MKSSNRCSFKWANCVSSHLISSSFPLQGDGEGAQMDHGGVHPWMGRQGITAPYGSIFVVSPPCSRVLRQRSEGVLPPPPHEHISTRICYCHSPSYHRYRWKTLRLFKTSSHLRAYLTLELLLAFSIGREGHAPVYALSVSCLDWTDEIGAAVGHTSRSSRRHAGTPASRCHWRDGIYGSSHQRLWALLLWE